MTNALNDPILRYGETTNPTTKGDEMKDASNMILTKQQLTGLKAFRLNPFAKVHHTIARSLRGLELLEMEIVYTNDRSRYDRRYTLTNAGQTELDLITGDWIAK